MPKLNYAGNTLLSIAILFSTVQVKAEMVQCQIIKGGNTARCNCPTTLVACGNRTGYAFNQDLSKLTKSEVEAASSGTKFSINGYDDLKMFKTIGDVSDENKLKDSNCAYVPGAMDSAPLVRKITVAEASKCTSYQPFSKLQIANVSCGLDYSKLTLCPVTNTSEALLDPNSCYRSSHVSSLKSLYFPKAGEGAFALSKWKTTTPYKGYIPVGVPESTILNGIAVCYGKAVKYDDLKKTNVNFLLIGPADGDGCETQTLVDDECFGFKSLAQDEMSVFEKLPGETTSGAIVDPSSKSKMAR